MNGSQALAGLVQHLPIEVQKSDDGICPIAKGCDIQDVLYNLRRVFDEPDKKRVDAMLVYLKNSLGFNENDTLYYPTDTYIKHCIYEELLKDPKGKVVWIKETSDKKEILLLTDKNGRNPTYGDGTPCPLEWTENAIRNYIANKNI
jgi:hypothetical protein